MIGHLAARQKPDALPEDGSTPPGVADLVDDELARSAA
jgi:hypothetical protein